MAYFMNESSVYGLLDVAGEEIRVLRVVTPSDNGRPPTFSIEHISLQSDKVPVYSAISYCWGQLTDYESISINGESVQTLRSAAEALTALPFKEGELLWIDAICINQEDLIEKAMQVSLMKKIYTQAQEVRVWLGHLPHHIAVPALDSVSAIYNQCYTITNGLLDLKKHMYQFEGSPVFMYSDEPLPDSCDWPAVEKFYSVPWFTRLWVIQEIALAKRATFYTGQDSIDSRVVIVAGRWLVHRRYQKHFGDQQVPGIENASTMIWPVKLPLRIQLQHTHRFDCRVDHDRVYGLLGLFRSDTADAITPNYSKPLVEVYAEAVRIALTEEGSLWLLQFIAWFVERAEADVAVKTENNQYQQISDITKQKDNRTWPSWVLRLKGRVNDDAGSCKNVLIIGKPERPEVATLEIRDVQDPLVLSIKGIVVDDIKFSGRSLSTKIMRDFSEFASTILENQSQYRESQTDKDSGSADKSFGLTLISGYTRYNEDAELDGEFTSRFNLFTKWCSDVSEETARQSDSSYKSGDNSESPPTFYYDIWGSSINRCFFTTSSGMIGMGPPGLQQGDHLCYLFGSKVPFILRKQDGHWRLIGDAYVRSIVNGDYIQALQADDLKARATWLDIH